MGNIPTKSLKFYEKKIIYDSCGTRKIDDEKKNI